MEGEFECLKPKLLEMLDINTTAKNKHVREIERKIRTVKDHVKCIKSTLPYINMVISHT